MMAEKRTYTSNQRKMFPTALECCDEDLRGKVRNRADFNYLDSSGNTLDLINATNRRGMEYVTPSTPLPPNISHRSSSTALDRAETISDTMCLTTWSITLT